MTGFSGTTDLSATPGRPACPSRASGWSSLTTSWGFPCCGRFPCVHAAATTPVQQPGVVFAHLTRPCQPSPKEASGRPAHRPFRGLLGVHSRCGLPICAVTNSRPATRRLQPFRYLHDCSGCFRLERLAGWDAHPLENAVLSRRPLLRDIGLCLGRVVSATAFAEKMAGARHC